MTLKRITTCIGTDADYIIKLLQSIYYNDEDCIYALSSTNNRILEIYLLNGLRFQGEFELDLPFLLYSIARFFKNDEDREAYMNSAGEYILIKDNKAFLEVEVDDDAWETTYYLGEEYILLEDKRIKTG